jgi:ACS family tartrate transporter-like MFS transporter
MPASKTTGAEDGQLRAGLRSVVRKVSLRLLPFLFMLYVVAYLDRVNVGFAALQMKSALRFSDSVYGFGAGIFFVGYLLFQVPSNFALVKFGARRWLAALMICWGIISASMMFVHTPFSFYTFRFLLGAAESGFYPGIILYLTYWFPLSARARSVSWLMMASPVSGLIGGPLSGFLLSLNGVRHLSGWQWLFLMEGIPAIILGASVKFILTEKPREAAWLEAAERETLLAAIEREGNLVREGKHAQQVPDSSARRSVLFDVIARCETWLLCGAYFALTWTSYGLGLWLPQLVKNFSGYSDRMVGVLTIAPYLFAVAVMVFIGAIADRTRQPHRTYAACAFAGAAGFFFSVHPHHVLLSTIFLSISAAGIYSAFGPFWAMPGEFLSGASAAAGIAFINSLGNLGGLFGPYVTGIVRQRTGSFAVGTLILGGVLFLSGILALGVKANQSSRPPSRTG